MTNEAGKLDGGHVLSHGQAGASLADCIDGVKRRIRDGGDKPHVSVDRLLDGLRDGAPHPRVASRERIVALDILESRYQGYRSSTTMLAQLTAVGFEDIELVWDDARLFPSVVARKPE